MNLLILVYSQKNKKSPTPVRIQTHDLVVLRRALLRKVTETREKCQIQLSVDGDIILVSVSVRAPLRGSTYSSDNNATSATVLKCAIAFSRKPNRIQSRNSRSALD